MIPLIKHAFLNEYETKNALADFILRAEKLSMGEKCLEFERKFAKFQESKHATLFNSGGSANLAMLQVLKNLGRIKQGAKIGFSALTWSTNVMPIIQLGFMPIPVDCNLETLNVHTDNLLERLEKTDLDVFFITNVLGFAGNLDKIRDFCSEKNIILIEDNCEALGTELDGKKTGTFGHMASFSFFVAHHMSTIEGGMVCTDDDELAQSLKVVRANGWDRNLNAEQQARLRKMHDVHSEFYAKYTFYDLGYNLRPTEITGFLGLCQMEYLEKNINKREENYFQLEKAVQSNEDLIILNHKHINKLSNFAFPILCKSKDLRDKYTSLFSGAGIKIRPMIAGNIQNQPFYKKYIHKNYDLPTTEQIDQCGFYCCNDPSLLENEIEVIKSALLKI